MLGRLGMDTGQALTAFHEVARRVFGKTKRNILTRKGKYKASTLKEEMGRIIRGSNPGYGEDELLCPTGAAVKPAGNV